MNTTISVRVQPGLPRARRISIGAGIAHMWHALIHRLFPIRVVGNPLYEAWTADGEPLERMTPEQVAKSCASRYVVVPHSRGR